jgi:hypothetical protein
MVPLMVYLAIMARSRYVQSALIPILPFMGVIIALLVYFWTLYSRQPGVKSLFYSSLVMAGLSIIAAFVVPATVVNYDNPKEAATKANLLAIQSALEAYAEKHEGAYPADIIELVQGGFLTEFPQNPFTKEPMNNIALGSSPFEGEFTYVPGIDKGQVRRYYLFCYGDKRTVGMDVNGDGVRDHVILVLSSYDKYITKEEPGLPSTVGDDLKDLLNGTKSTAE